MTIFVHSKAAFEATQQNHVAPNKKFSNAVILPRNKFDFFKRAPVFFPALFLFSLYLFSLFISFPPLFIYTKMTKRKREVSLLKASF